MAKKVYEGIKAGLEEALDDMRASNADALPDRALEAARKTLQGIRLTLPDYGDCYIDVPEAAMRQTIAAFLRAEADRMYEESKFLKDDMPFIHYLRDRATQLEGQTDE